MTVKSDRGILRHWEVSQDDFGAPLIFHRHMGEADPAYVIATTDNGEAVAQCSDCMAILELRQSWLDPEL